MARWQLIFSTSVAIGLLCSSPGHADDKLLAMVRLQNRTAIESIHDFYCRYQISARNSDGSPPIAQKPAGEYWRSGKMQRWRSRTPGSSSETVVKEGRQIGLYSFPENQGKQIPRGSIGPDLVLNGEVDPWFTAMFVFFGDTVHLGRYTFDESLSLPTRPQVNAVEKRTEGGKNVIVIKTSRPGSETTFWFDPQVNYLISKRVGSSGTSRTDTVVEEFKETAEGIYFPSRIRSTRFDKGKLLTTEVVTFTDIRINESLPESLFEIRFPAGIRVVDQLRGVEYTTEADGKPSEETKELFPPPPPTGKETSWTETKEEPRSWTGWIFPTSLGILSLAGIIWLVRRGRSSVS